MGIIPPHQRGLWGGAFCSVLSFRMDDLVRTVDRLDDTMDKITRKMGKEKDIGELSYKKELTMVIDVEGPEKVTIINLLKTIRMLCGGILGCRPLGPTSYEITLSNEVARDKLMDGFKMGATVVTGRKLVNDELIVSFLNLPAYISDEEIVEKLQGWGVEAVTKIKRRMWPGTTIVDGTRFVRVRFTDAVQSLPYSTKFNTANGHYFFRVIHDRQVRVCRLCLQPGHIVRECPEFVCHKCGGQGHYARECVEGGGRCTVCCNPFTKCVCASVSEEDGQDSTEEEVSDELGEVDLEVREPPGGGITPESLTYSARRAPEVGGTQKMGPACDPAGGARKMGSTLDTKDQAVELAQGGAQVSSNTRDREEKQSKEYATDSEATSGRGERRQLTPELRSEPLPDTCLSPVGPSANPPSSGSDMECQLLTARKRAPLERIGQKVRKKTKMKGLAR